MSTQIWQDEGVEQWQESGPDMTVELAAGQVLAVPRGWVHNPHARNATETSVHLTFVLKERTPLWAAERLISSSINDPRFRAVIPPADLDPLRMPELVRDVRGLMIDYLTELDIEQMARALRNAAEKETSHTAL